MTDRARRPAIVAKVAALAAASALAVVLLAPIASTAEGQKTVVVLTPAAGTNPTHDVFAKALQNQGWAQNKIVRIETRHWGGNVDTLQRFVAEIVELKPDVVAAWG